MTFLQLNNVSHYYFTPTNYTKALEQISLTISAGEFVSIIGPSGCGKSTILSLIAQLIKQTEGEITVEGQPIAQSDVKVGYMLQQDYLLTWKRILITLF